MSNHQKPIDFIGEENELYDTCSISNAAVYKWFDMIRVEFSSDESQKTATVYFGKMLEDTVVPKDIAKQIRSYVKEQKKAIRENPRGFTAEEGRKKVFWLLTMFIEHGVFVDHGIGKLQTYASFIYCQTHEDD